MLYQFNWVQDQYLGYNLTVCRGDGRTIHPVIPMGLWPKAGLVTPHVMERPRRVPHIYELFDEIQILKRSACRSLPSLAFPSWTPDGRAVDGIL